MSGTPLNSHLELFSSVFANDNAVQQKNLKKLIISLCTKKLLLTLEISLCTKEARKYRCVHQIHVFCTHNRQNDPLKQPKYG